MNLQEKSLAVIENIAAFKSYSCVLHKLAGGIIEGDRIVPVHNWEVGYRVKIKVQLR